MPDPQKAPTGGIIATSEFIRHRNALLTRARLTDLYLDYYLHLADKQISISPEQDPLLKQLLAVVVLHCASRPRNEIMAWSINLQDPLCNLFAAGDNEDGTVVGRAFTENIKRGPSNLFFLETVHNRGEKRRSVVNFHGSDLFAAGEAFYRQSEQRAARIFDLGNETFAMLSEHPDCDTDWLHGIGDEEILAIYQSEIVVSMENRIYHWRCGCSEFRMLGVLAPEMRRDPEGLFGGEDSLRVDCPRCGGHYRITREALEAYTAEHGA